ncbi:MAG: sigma-70 family RNA polymerase sigma factor [Planctomycetes bacterium]|nr:sigma-70 family RNA polymerase sigma factor [Planctomycetota bacterium]
MAHCATSSLTVDAPGFARQPTAALTRRIARGDQAAFASFYEAWFDRAVALARRVLREAGDDEALDVAQDVMVRAAMRLPPLRDEAAVTAWMARVVYTVAIDRVRQRLRRAARERAVARREDDDVADAAADVARREQLDWLRGALLELPEADRRFVLERFGGVASLAELGRSFGMTGHAFSGRIRRALTRLREMANEVFDV